ncbi:MAG TPA: zinc-binding dehydrogenase, partial [candidate division Zixibacteria bacterium]|nr:zinc-binding dehydrogenase [candidate division Zixibacteria bacterium]
DIAFDCVAGPGVQTLIKALGFGSRLVIYGALDSRPMEIKPMAMMVREMTMYTHMIFHAMADLDVRRAGVEYVTGGIEAGDFTPQIAKTYAFEEIAAAHEYMQSNQQIGKIVVTV